MSDVPIVAVIALPSAVLRQLCGSLEHPYNPSAASTVLRQLGEHLDDQANHGASMGTLDATLTAMSRVHNRMMTELGTALEISRPKALTVRQDPRTRALGAAA